MHIEAYNYVKTSGGKMGKVIVSLFLLFVSIISEQAEAPCE